LCSPRPVDNDSISYIELKVNSFFENNQNVKMTFFIIKRKQGSNASYFDKLA